MKHILIKPFRLIAIILFLPFWWLERLIPRNKHIFIFGAWFGQKYSDNSKALFEHILNTHLQYKPYWITHNKNIYEKLLKENKPVLMAYSLKGWLTSLRASAAFIGNAETDVNKYALNGAKQIWLWHGMPIKKIGIENKDNYFHLKNKQTGKKIKLLLFKFFKPYSYFRTLITSTIVSGKFFKPIFESTFCLKEDSVWNTGLPRTDCYYLNKTEKIISYLHNKYANPKILLWMPTFRKHTFNPFSLPEFDGNYFSDLLVKENSVLLLKLHEHDRTIIKSFSDRLILISDNDYEEMYVLISNIDILITDYSSIYFDFLCLKKPVILTPFDYEEYIKESREHFFDYSLLPGIKAHDWHDLINIITEKKYYSLSKEETDKFSMYNDGHASERCFQKTVELLER